MLTKLILIRHGQTDLSGRYVGSTDIPLAEQGQKQITALRPLIKDLAIDQVFCSPMLRCQQSCELLFSGRDIIEDPQLREIDFGRWEGKSFKEIAKQDSELVENWSTWSEQFCFPEGEKVQNFINRVAAFSYRVQQANNETIALVTHGGVIRCMICHLLGISQENYLLFKVLTGTITTLDLFGDKGVLTSLNICGIK